MSEKAVIFFTLLNESYRLSAEERLQEITVNSVPHMDSADAKKVMSSYEQASRDIMDVIKDDDNYDNLSKLKDGFEK